MSKSPNTPYLKWFIKEWREYRDLTLEQLAEMVGTNKGQISKLENEKQRKNDDWILKLSTALKVSPADLLRSPDDTSVKNLWEIASDEDRRVVDRIVKGYLGKK